MKSIRRHLTFSLVLGFILLLGVGGLAVYFLTRAELVREFDAGLQAKALTLITLTSQDHGRLGIEDLPPGFQNKAGTEFFQLWQPDGTIAQHSASLGGRKPSMPFRNHDEAAVLESRFAPGFGRPGHRLGIFAQGGQ